VILRRAFDGLVMAAFALPLSSMWQEPDVPLALKLAGALVLVVTAARPAIGLCLAAGMLPVAPVIGIIAGAQIGPGGVEALVLPFLIAGFGRLAMARGPMLSRIAWPAWVFAGVIAAGCATLVASDAQIWRHLTREYVVDARGFRDLHLAAGWIEALALAVLIERLARAHPASIEPAVRLAIVGAGAAAALAANRVADVMIRSDDALGALAWLVREYRFSAFYPDLNAAGSVYALFLVPAVWLAAARRQHWAWLAVASIGLALWFSGSRAALLAAVAGTVLAWWLARRLPRRWWIGATAVAIVVASVVVWSGRHGRATAGEAVAIRWDLAMLGLRVAATKPVLGVGVGRMPGASAPLVTPDLARRFPPAAAGENAHNNFVQILAESGPIALAAFLWILVIPAAGWRRLATAAEAAGDRPGLLGGLAAFVLTCLAGHPLITEHIRLCFFFWIGIAAAAGRRQAAGP
jgi:hypothetical protein